MNNSVINLSILNLSIAYIFVLILLLIFKTRGIKREKQILIATTRMTLQLTIMGYIFMYIFENPKWWLTVILIIIMLIFAVFNALKRIKTKMSIKLKKLVVFSMIFGYIITSSIFMFIVLQIKPWFNPQYFIPISGMIVGNSMTGIALGANRLCSEMKNKRDLIENSLMLGASPSAAVHDIVNDSFDSAILPTMNNMLTMGIVSLPGMMTGQILSGTFPITAIKYQIGITLAILGCTSLTVVLFVNLGYKTFFTLNASLNNDSI